MSDQKWITAYTQDDVNLVIKWSGIKSDIEICKELNITLITLKEIINTNDKILETINQKEKQ